MFFHRRVFIIEMFFYAVVDEACRATLEIGHLSLVHLRSLGVG